MSNCKRCGTPIVFENYKCFDAITRIPHNITQCKTKDGYVWCPTHKMIYLKRAPCQHYIDQGYNGELNEQFYIKLINENYHRGDWFTRKQRWAEQRVKMKNSVCTICKKSVMHLSEPQQAIHAKMHLNEQRHQKTISRFF